MVQIQIPDSVQFIIRTIEEAGFEVAGIQDV